MKFRYVNKTPIDWSGETETGELYRWNTLADRVTEGVHGRTRRGSTEFNWEPVTDPKLVQQIKEAMKQHETD